MMYQQPVSAISEVVNELLSWINQRWGKLLGFNTEGILAPEKLESYEHVIHQAGAPLPPAWAFLGCTIWVMC